ncbi:MAG: FtsX-like permease family protein [Pirellulales bacterium]|nr:FtsX-like permease family protein [Pirellulales bacterium]
MWTIAAKTLIADRGKLLTALVGVVFSVVLLNVQGGLFIGLIRKASLLVDQGDADIWVGHQKMTNVDFPNDVPRRWVQRIRAVDGVAHADPYLVGYSVMTLPDGGFEPVLVVGCEPSSLVGSTNRTISGDASVLRKADAIIVDWYDRARIGNPKVGDIREIGKRRGRVVDFSVGILGFSVTPYVFTTIDRAREFLDRPAEVASYFLVKAQDGADVQEICRQIRQRLPDAEAFTKDKYASESVGFWLRRTGLGISFGAATLLGLLVGLVVVAETLYASVLDRLSEFGALKAIGAAERQIYGIVFSQAFLLAAMGSAVGLALVALIQASFSTPRAPIAVPWFVSIGSCLLVSAICFVSSALPYLRIRQVDPAMVLQS